MIPQTALAEGTTEQASTGYQTEEQTDAAQTEETTDAAQEQDGTDKTSVETSDSSDGESAETENGSVSVSESTDISDHGADFRSGEKANEPGESYPAVSFNTKADDGKSYSMTVEATQTDGNSWVGSKPSIGGQEVDPSAKGWTVTVTDAGACTITADATN